MYEKKGALGSIPTVGAQVFFTKNGKSSGCYHTGIVYQVDNNYFYTIEGNTTTENTVVSNGGGVAKKKYLISKYKNKVLFGYPKYEVATKSDITTIAKEVLAGKWGNGSVRKDSLTAAGYNYKEVQAEVNRLSGK